MTCPLCRFLTLLRAWIARRRQAVRELEKQSRQVHHGKVRDAVRPAGCGRIWSLARPNGMRDETTEVRLQF
jgi:hypothetical protein